MEFKEVIESRYSCKKYSDKKVEREKLEAVLEAGRLAPTARNLQEQHVYVLESREALDKFDIETPCRYGAPTVLVVAFDTTNVYVYPGEKRDSGIEDASIVATLMILAATDQGLNSCWINGLYSWLWTLGTLQRKELRYRITLSARRLVRRFRICSYRKNELIKIAISLGITRGIAIVFLLKIK